MRSACLSVLCGEEWAWTTPLFFRLRATELCACCRLRTSCPMELQLGFGVIARSKCRKPITLGATTSGFRRWSSPYLILCELGWFFGIGSVVHELPIFRTWNWSSPTAICDVQSQWPCCGDVESLSRLKRVCVCVCVSFWLCVECVDVCVVTGG